MFLSQLQSAIADQALIALVIYQQLTIFYLVFNQNWASGHKSTFVEQSAS